MVARKSESGSDAGSIGNVAAMLRAVPFLSDVELAHLKLLAYVSERLDFDDGDIVFEQDSNGNDVYFVLDGKADVLASTDHGQMLVATLPRHALFGEISAFCDVPRTAGVRASGALSVLRIPQAAFLSLIEESPSLALKVVRELASRLSRTTHELARVQAR